MATYDIDARGVEISENVTNNYNSFFDFIVNSFIKTIKNNNRVIKIILTPNLTCSQRYSIHKYTSGKDFYGKTEHDIENTMTIYISNKFYKSLVPVNFKKMAFEKHMVLLEELYPEEFANFFK